MRSSCSGTARPSTRRSAWPDPLAAWRCRPPSGPAELVSALNWRDPTAQQFTDEVQLTAVRAFRTDWLVRPGFGRETRDHVRPSQCRASLRSRLRSPRDPTAQQSAGRCSGRRRAHRPLCWRGDPVWGRETTRARPSAGPGSARECLETHGPAVGSGEAAGAEQQAEPARTGWDQACPSQCRTERSLLARRSCPGSARHVRATAAQRVQ